MEEPDTLRDLGRALADLGRIETACLSVDDRMIVRGLHAPDWINIEDTAFETTWSKVERTLAEFDATECNTDETILVSTPPGERHLSMTRRRQTDDFVVTIGLRYFVAGRLSVTATVESDSNDRVAEFHSDAENIDPVEVGEWLVSASVAVLVYRTHEPREVIDYLQTERLGHSVNGWAAIRDVSAERVSQHAAAVGDH